MEIQTPVTKTIIKAEPIDLGHDRLLEALFFFWDGFERSNMNFFLTGKTADQVKSDILFEGDRLTLGIRLNEWVGGQGRIFKDFMEHEHMVPKKVDEDTLLFNYKNIPVYVKKYEDNPYITALDISFYHNETFNIPNPLKDFELKYG